jgi:flagellar biosynthesis GTPase FlhF
MLKSKMTGGLAIAMLTAGIVATAASGAELSSPNVPSSPDEQAATADLNKKIADDVAALDSSEKAKAEAYERQVKQQQETYEQQVKQQQTQYEQQKSDYARLLEEQKTAYQRQLEEQKAEHQRQLEQYERQVNAGNNQSAKSAR